LSEELEVALLLKLMDHPGPKVIKRQERADIAEQGNDSIPHSDKKNKSQKG
jgi:hypothetical protein